MSGHRILILGAGFGGLFTALELTRRLRREEAVEIVLLDARNFHLFSPLLHEVTSGSVEPRHVVWPIRSIRRRRPLTFERRAVRSIALDRRRVLTDRGEVAYDSLVIALGSTTNYFGARGAAEKAFSFKSLHDAVRLRNHLLEMYEQADLERDPERRRRLLTFVLVGAGCTGVELATELWDLIRGPLARSYPRVDPGEGRVVILEATQRVIPCVSDRLAALGLEKLRAKGIEVRLQAPAVAVRDEGVELGDAEVLPTATVIWTAGVKANPVVEALPVERDKLGRVVVDEHLQVPPFPGVFAIGDAAHCWDPGLQAPLPPTGQVAVQQARAVARNIARELQGKPKEPFRYRHQGDLVSLGTGDGVGEIAGLAFSGLPAWLLWRSVFLAKLIGWKNRVRVALDWVIAAFFPRDLARLEW
ncbi:MAG: NAD(P)/FAD-dependent oxidoreductase [candidate division NC10 bacterium]|nr:NAD(P)/FAD-dependent oxidoreductase [candidate division NC10 bacterium]